MKKMMFWIILIQVLILVTMLIRSEPFSLLSYINNSFVYGGVLVFIGLWMFVIRTGAFDIFTMSMRKFFKGKSTLEDDEMRSPSEIFSLSSAPLLIVGCVTLLLMALSLALYEF